MPWLLTLLCLALLAAPAAAADSDTVNQDTTYFGGSFGKRFSHPNDDEGRLDCNPNTAAHCAPLNRAACGEANNGAARQIELVLSTSQTVLPNSKFYLWLQPGESCTDDKKSNSDSAGKSIINGHVLASTDGLVVAGQPLTVPTELGTTQLWTSDIFALLKTANEDPCPLPAGSGGIQTKYVSICLGLDGGAAPDGTVSASDTTSGTMLPGDLLGWAKIAVDTVPPSAPAAPVLTPLDGRIKVALTVPSTNSADVTRWEVRLRPALLAADGTNAPDADPAVTITDCSTWWDKADKIFTNDSQSVLTTTMEVGADNGTRYAVCAQVKDALGNASAPSTVSFATPLDECDFMECYPSELETGYCGATGQGSGAGLLLSLYMLARWRRKEKR